MKCFLYVMGVALVEGAAPDSAVQRMSQCNVRAARLGATRIPIVENKADWVLKHVADWKSGSFSPCDWKRCMVGLSAVEALVNNPGTLDQVEMALSGLRRVGNQACESLDALLESNAGPSKIAQDLAVVGIDMEQKILDFRNRHNLRP